MRKQGLSVIVPTYNEEPNIRGLIDRVVATLDTEHIPYEIIFIDDHSDDATVDIIQTYGKPNIQVFRKRGKKGKGHSIIEGAQLASYTYVAMLDADLQYPPEILPELYRGAQKSGLSVARRRTYRSTFLRTIASRLNMFIIGHLLLNLKTDIQSGLKVFNREVFDHLDERLVDAWSIDIPLIHTAYELGFTAHHVDIAFHPRIQGKSHVRFFSTALQIAKGAIRTKLSQQVRYLQPEPDSMKGSGLAYRRKRFVTHTTLSHRLSALENLSPAQKIAIGAIVTVIAGGFLVNPIATAIVCTAIISSVYFADVLFNLFVILKSLHFPPEIRIPPEAIGRLRNKNLPVYSILCPLYKEADVLPQFVTAMDALDWPKNKLDILILLEEDDTETITAAKSLNLPPYYRLIIVPHSEPKTKPKASNYGLNHAKGEYIVVFDAEDKPDPYQLKKAYIAFRQANPNVVCMQAKLNYYNPHDNLLTRLFTAEYSLWFDVVLPGLQSIQTTIPLGGTSNHFRTAQLLALQGWDPFNVTEDADLGARLFRQGYKTAIIDSVTLEEANSNVRNWIRQRSRWIKGYIQTYFVHFRNPIAFARNYGKHALLFQLIIGGKIAFMLINPILWAITISYFALFGLVGPTIERIYPASVFYMAAFSLVFGNFIYFYNYMLGVAKRGQWELVKYVLLIPFYWLMISISAGVALIQFFVKPYYWEKTVHGLHLKRAVSASGAVQTSRGSWSLSQALRGRHVASLILIGSTFAANILNFLYNAYLGRKLTLDEFGTVSLIGGLLYIANVPLGSLSRTVAHRSAYLLGKLGYPNSRFWTHILTRVRPLSVGAALVWLALLPILSNYFRTDSMLPFLLFAPVWIIGAMLAVDMGYLNGSHRFAMYAAVLVFEALIKILLSIIGIEAGQTKFVYAAIPLSMLAALAIAHMFASINSERQSEFTDADVTRWPKKFFATSVLSSLTGISFLSMDLLLAKHYLAPSLAGSYALLTLVGKMVYFLSSVVSQFTVPLISHEVGANQKKSIFPAIFLAVMGMNAAAVVAFGFFGVVTVPLLWGKQTETILPHLPFYTTAMALFSITGLIVSYNQIRGRYLFPIAGFILSLTHVIGIILFHDSVGVLVGVICVSSAVSLAGITLLHIFYDPIVTVSQNIHDLLGLFSMKSPAPVGGKLRILIFNWRDLKHIWAGGAEVYIHELAKRWVKTGHSVTVFCGNDQKSKRYETIDGVSIVRRGGFYMVYLWAFLYYLRFFRGKFDVIIDSENGLPFFTPLYAKEKKYLLIHHVHQEVFRKRLLPPFSWIAMILEKRLMPLVYRHTDVLTVSPSSKADILAYNITKKDPKVVFNGIDTASCRPGKKSEVPTLLYLGRLTALKSVQVFLKAAKDILQTLPNVQIVIAGDGPDKANLERLSMQLGIAENVHFTGKVSESEKILLYQQAWVFVNPSLIEGWGITTIEANACGTPVVASNVPGLRDAVRNPHTGLLVPYGDINGFARAIMRLITDTRTRKRMSEGAVKWSHNFDWNKSADDAIRIISE